jgi:hypothetical protein
MMRSSSLEEEVGTALLRTALSWLKKHQSAEAASLISAYVGLATLHASFMPAGLSSGAALQIATELRRQTRGRRRKRGR